MNAVDSRIKRSPKRNFNENEFFISNKNNFVYLLKRIKKKLEKDDVILHGMGKAIHTTVRAYLELQKFYGASLSSKIETSTEKLFDEVTREGSTHVEERLNSCLHIKLCVKYKSVKK